MGQLAIGATTGADDVERAATGDKLAFAQLIAQHHAQMMRVAYVIAGDQDLANDAVQSAWEIAWKRLRDLRDQGQVRSWLVAVAANEARGLRRRQRRHRVVDISTQLDLPGATDAIDHIAVLDLKRALSNLSPDDRMLLALRYVARLDSNEIAKHLGLSASGTRSRLSRLLDRLRVELEAGAER